MVDEFQDTNRLQVELIDRVAGDELFLVGDEFQSIYRFRHADVAVYRERRRQAGDEVVTLSRNYRSRPSTCWTPSTSCYRREFRRPTMPPLDARRGVRRGSRRPAGGWSCSWPTSAASTPPGSTGVPARCDWWPTASPS